MATPGFEWTFGTPARSGQEGTWRATGLQPGTWFGGYRVEALLGQGAMGTVLRAFDPELQRPVALKLLQGTRDEARLRRFQREGALCATLDHPGIVRVHAGGVSGDGRPFLVMELIEGARELTDVMRQADLPTALGLLLQVARATGYAHRQGVVHRDIKPGNILVDAYGQAHVCDFGLAWSEDAERLTRTGAMVGTPSWMAPEQLGLGPRRDPTPAADVWSLGVILYQHLTGQLPFPQTSLLELSAAIAAAQPVPPRQLAPTIPPALQAVCLRALEKDPGDRYPDGEAFAAALEPAMAAPLPRRRRLAALAGLAVAATALAALRAAVSPAPEPLAPRPSAAPSPPSAAAPPGGDPEPPPTGESRPPERIGPSEDLELPLPEETLHALAPGPDAIWLGGPGFLLRCARQPGSLAQGQRIAVAGQVVGLACPRSTPWVLYAAEARLHVARLEGERWVEVWSEPGDAERGAQFLAWAEGEATRLLTAAGTCVWLLRVGEGDAVQALRLDCPVDWIRGAVFLPEVDQVALCGNGRARLSAFVGGYDTRSGTLAWSRDYLGTVTGLAPAGAGRVLVGVRESNSVEVMGPDLPQSEEEPPGDREPKRARIRDLVRAGERLYALAFGAEGQRAELITLDPSSLKHRSRRFVDGYLGQLSWDPVWEGVWIATPRGATFCPAKTP